MMLDTRRTVAIVVPKCNNDLYNLRKENEKK